MLLVLLRLRSASEAFSRGRRMLPAPARSAASDPATSGGGGRLRLTLSVAFALFFPVMFVSGRRKGRTGQDGAWAMDEDDCECGCHEAEIERIDNQKSR